MAKAISYVPKQVDPKLELQQRLQAAPNEHAEALLVAYDLLEEAHRQGVLDALHGAIHARETIFRLSAEYLTDPVGVNALRNLLAMGKVIGTVDPESISNFSQQMKQESGGDPPSLWSMFKIIRRPDARRGLSMLIALLSAVGRITDQPSGRKPNAV
jgi:uncharacterized protein YjgD (DUF1641 family)